DDALIQKLDGRVAGERAQILASIGSDAEREFHLHDLELRRIEALFRRALGVDAFSHGYAGKPEWQKFIAPICGLFAELGDTALFAVRGRCQEPNEDQGGGERELQMATLVYWIAGSLWRMRSHPKQLELIERLHPSTVLRRFKKSDDPNSKPVK